MSVEDTQILAARRQAWLTLSLVAGLGPITLRRAVEQAFGVLGAIKLSHAGWGEVEGIGSYRATQIVKDLPRAVKEAAQIQAGSEAAGISIVTLEDEAYPALARDLSDVAPVLYVRGTLEPRDLNAVAIVGSRKCSFYGRDQASRLAALLAGAGATVVSGGARGVDSASHEGALRVAGGRTIAVLGCGVDIVYPPENKELFAKIIDGGGAVISHYPPGTPPNQRHFPERNRLISAISRGVLVIEADERSGSLITARIAADDHNRPVLALPGRVDNPLSTGPHQLIRQGAALVMDLPDILDALGPLPDGAYRPQRHTPPEGIEDPKVSKRTSGPQGALSFDAAPASKTKLGKGAGEKPASSGASPSERHRVPAARPSSPAPAGHTDEQARILVALGEYQEAAAETLIEETGLPAAVVLRELTMLTLKGAITRVDAQTFALRK